MFHCLEIHNACCVMRKTLKIGNPGIFKRNITGFFNTIFYMKMPNCSLRNKPYKVA